MKRECTTHKQTDISMQLKRMATGKKRHISDSGTVSLPNNHSKASKRTFPCRLYSFILYSKSCNLIQRERKHPERKKASCKCNLYAAEDSFLKKTGNLQLILDLLCFVTHSCQKIPRSQESQRLSSSNFSVSFHLLSVCVRERILRMTVTEKSCKVMKAHIESNGYWLDQGCKQCVTI